MGKSMNKDQSEGSFQETLGTEYLTADSARGGSMGSLSNLPDERDPSLSSHRGGVLCSETTFFSNRGEPEGLKVKRVSTINKILNYIKKVKKKEIIDINSVNSNPNQNKQPTLSEYLEELKSINFTQNPEKKSKMAGSRNPLVGRRRVSKPASLLIQSTDERAANLKKMALEHNHVVKCQSEQDQNILGLKTKVTKEFIKV